ncbi:TetR/AcrR family transcriptional regulator [Bacillus sp. HMF5848]|uniref:TetR/AcrR family transcriptional regulator n=1 Tax=Bacillus sp. HMF5848 TaxID=2495421 RepID=UPI000F781593|nr:TetR/AcrR family transcriptional regulator [Bacillus sp. HMF5848]RSK27367.1 TetR/AcrR family transcriptional regulator [Bacillus sp. HMF5848]
MKENIINESIILFEKKGFSQTSIQDIVEAIGVTKGTFYYYYSSKEELLMDIHLGYIDSLLENQKQINEIEDTCKQKLREIVYLLVHAIETEGPQARIFFREMRHLSKDNYEKIIEKRENFRIVVEKIVEKGMEKGEFRNNLNAKMTSFAILGVTNWSYQWYNPSGPINDKQLTDIYMDLILNGLIA